MQIRPYKSIYLARQSAGRSARTELFVGWAAQRALQQRMMIYFLAKLHLSPGRGKSFSMLKQRAWLVILAREVNHLSRAGS